MKKSGIIVIIVACAILFVGLACTLVALIRIGFDFSKISTTKTNLEAQTVTYTPEKVNDIVLEIAPTDRLTVRKSVDGDAHFSYYTCDEFTYTLTLPDEAGNGGISLLCNDNRRWWEYIGFGFSFGNEIVVELPEEYIGNLTVSSDTGKISLSELELSGDLLVESSTGDISCSDITANGIAIDCSTANTELRHIACTSLNLKSSTGKMEITDVTVFGPATVKNTTGGIRASGLDAASVDLKTSTGDIRLAEISAKSYSIEASTGNIKGSIVGKESDFTFNTKTSTGTNNLPESFGSGSIPLNVRTSTGNIKISFTD